MELLVKRMARKDAYTIGRLYVNGKYFCDTVEDCDRLYFGKPKVVGLTAIPVGRYEVLLNNYSPKFGAKEPYKSVCNGCVPLIANVPQFSGVRIHCGNTAQDSRGCIIVGINKKVGMVLESKATFTSLMKKHLLVARDNKEEVYITIQ